MQANLRWSRNYFVLGDLLLPRKIAGSVFSIQPNQPKGKFWSSEYLVVMQMFRTKNLPQVFGAKLT